MKKVLFLLSFCLLFVPGIHSQSIPAEEKQVEVNESLSALFSKQFLLPHKYIMNYFEFIINGDSIEFSYPIGTRSAHHSYDYPQMRQEIVDAISQWKQNIGLPDSLPQTGIRYAPFYYAETGDTLFLDCELFNTVNSYGELAAMYYRFYVHNDRNMPHFAIVQRKEYRLTLRIYDAKTRKPIAVEHDWQINPQTLVKNGMLYYLAENGKTIQRRQFYERDTIRYAEELDSLGNVCAKCAFRIPLKAIGHPFLRNKEILYPSGAVKMRLDYDENGITISAFNEDGSQRNFVPAKNVKKTISKYFKKNFKVPSIPEKRGINEIILKTQLTGTVSEKGELKVKKNGSATHWNYNYNTHFISGGQVSKVIDDVYSPYFDKFMEEMRQQTLSCPPATIDGQAVETPFVLLFEYKFIP